MESSVQSDVDRPAWAALTTHHAHLGWGDDLARRYDPDVAPFAGLATETAVAYQHLRALLRPGEQVALQSLAPLRQHDNLSVTPVGVIHQMIGGHCKAAANQDERIVSLSHADAREMLALAQRTKPGPFAERTCETGRYIGIRDNGRLVAMAGERMRLHGHVEISAVCVDDAYRGQGLAGTLVNALWREIERRGDIPFLHVFSDNRAAISLYERLGFSVRRDFYLSRVGLADPASGTAG